MRHLVIRAYLAERDRMLQELAARPRLDRAESKPPLARRVWERVRPSVAPSASPERGVTIRAAGPTDVTQLIRLAEMAERRVPTGHVLVAQVESELVAALPVAGGPVIADLRRSTADVVQLLELRSRQLRRAQRAREAA